MNPALSSSHEQEWLGLSDLLDAQIEAVLQRKDIASKSFSLLTGQWARVRQGDRHISDLKSPS